jgi:hypothetical protein
MRCYNAAMNRRWQFSMRALFALAFSVCIASWACAVAPRLMIPVNFGLAIGVSFVAWCFLGAWIGGKFDNRFAGLMVALGILIFAAIVVIATDI